MKKIITLSFLLFVANLAAQSNLQVPSLENTIKINAGTQGIDAAIELPISKSILWEFSTGLGGFNLNTDNTSGYEMSSDLGFAFFAKSQFKYMLSRKHRAEKGNNLANNSGSFLGFQTKFNNNNKLYGSVIMNEFHWGQQLPLSNSLQFYYHIGVGHNANLNFSSNEVYPAFGLKLVYTIVNF